MNHNSEIQRIDSAHHFHPFTDQGRLNRLGSRIFVKGEGVYVYTESGQRLLDGMSGLWCVNVGYGRKELAEAAANQMNKLPYYNSFFQCTTDTTARLAQKLAQIAPEDINHCFFCGSGSEANDTVIRLLRHFWACQGKAKRFWFISRKNAYHGSSMGSASLGGMSFMHAQGGLPIPGIAHIEQPYYFDLGRGRDPQEFGIEIARRLEEKILELGPESVAAFIAEPIQGAGGVIIPPPSYWPEIGRICRKYDVPLVADEVICGFGRLGYWFGGRYFGIEPDVIVTAKGMSSGYLPIGAVLFNDRIAETLFEKGGEFNHGYTYSGHPTCAAVALRNIAIIEEEGLLTKVRADSGPYLSEALQKLASHALVGEVRSVGLIAGIELVADKENNRRWDKEIKITDICREECIDAGVIARGGSASDTMMLAPPLIIERSQIDEMVDRLKIAFDRTLEKASEKASIKSD